MKRQVVCDVDSHATENTGGYQVIKFNEQKQQVRELYKREDCNVSFSTSKRYLSFEPKLVPGGRSGEV
jgi:hypothetical protein